MILRALQPAARMLLLAVLASALAGGVPRRVAVAAPPDPASARNRAAALLDNGDEAKAVALFRDLVRAFPTSVPDRVNLGIALLNHNDLDGAESELRKAIESDPKDLRARYNLGILLKRRGKNEEGASQLEVVAATPEGKRDASVQYNLGILYKRLRRGEDALAAFQRAVAIRPDHVSAHFQIYNELVQRGDRAKAQPEIELFKTLQKATPEFQRTETYLERGAFTRIDAPGSLPPGANRDLVAQPRIDIRFERAGAAVGGAKGDGGSGVAGRPQARSEEVAGGARPAAALADFDGDGDLDIAIASNEGKAVIFRQQPAGVFSSVLATMDLGGGPAADGRTSSTPGAGRAIAPGLAAADVDNDADADLLIAMLGGVRLFFNDGKGRFTDVTKGSGLDQVGPASDAAWLDADRDGDLDLALAGGGEEPRPRLYLNAGLYPAAGGSPGADKKGAAGGGPPDADKKGAAGDGPPNEPGARAQRPGGSLEESRRFFAAGAEAALPRCGETVTAADLEGRGDIGLVFACRDGSLGLGWNLRAGRFKPEVIGVPSTSAPAAGAATTAQERSNAGAGKTARPGTRIRAGDLDGDGHVDLVHGSGGAIVVRWGDEDATLGELTSIGDFSAGAGSEPESIALLDADGDGDLDVAMTTSSSESEGGGGKIAILRNDALRRFTALPDVGGSLPGRGGDLLTADLDGDGDPDLATSAPGGGAPVVLANVTRSPNRFLKVSLVGGKSNRSGAGAMIEVRAERLVVRRQTDGNPLVVGIGPHGRADAVQVVWTSGVSQDLIDVPAGRVKIDEKREFAGSCPFLYAWDGATFRFVGEALSGAPVGFLKPDGTFEKPRPLEHLRLPPELPAERGGRLSLRMTEEMRELTALDSVRLVAVDHPAGVEVYSNERLREAEEPFRYLAVTDLRSPVAASEVLLDDALTGRVAGLERDHARDAAGAVKLSRSEETAADAATMAAISSLDDRAPDVFPIYGPRLEGLAAPHVLVLRFKHPAHAVSNLARPGDLHRDGESSPPSEKLALVLDGWVAWTTSDVSRALLQARGARAQPPSAPIARPPAPPPDPEPSRRVEPHDLPRGSFAGRPIPASPEPWGPAFEARDHAQRTFEPDMGLPIGPSMVAPLPGALAEGPIEIRIGSNLGMYYDRVRMGRIIDAPMTIREIAPALAELRWRGVAASRRHRDDRPPRPDYDDVSPLSPFQRLGEETTPPGDVMPLVADADGRFVTFGTGEEVALEFDAGAVPPPSPGLTRTWFLVSLGYARDGDPNTAPLPWGN